jgi:hypothetical protein
MRKWYLLFGLGILVAANFNLLYLYATQAKQQNCSRAYLFKNPPSWTSYQNIFHWLRTHSQPNDIMASMEDPMIFLYTGRRAIRPFRINPGFGEDQVSSGMLGSEEELYQTLKTYKVRYLIEFPTLNRDQVFKGLIAKMEVKYPRSLKQVYTCKDKRFSIYEFTRVN